MRLLRDLTIVVVLLAFIERPAHACGPELPPNLLLSSRGTTLQQLPPGMFAELAPKIVSPQQHFVVVETEEEPAGARAEAGAEEGRLYAAGARAFHAGKLDLAARGFDALLTLPPEKRRTRSTWAAFMRGRIEVARVTGARVSTARDEAIANRARDFFARTRAFAAEGFTDTLGLAVASFGEEGRLALARGELALAARAYLQQAALGSASGVLSARIVAHKILDDGERFAAHMADPVVHRLVVTLLFTHGADAARIEAIAALNVPHVAGADALAAASYRAGQFDTAARMLTLVEAPTVTSSWVGAKLALRAGAPDEAARLLQAGAMLAPSTSVVVLDFDTRPTRARMLAEAAGIALSRGRFADAFALLASDDALWPDAAYVGDRILTVDELKAWVDAHPTDGATPLVQDPWGPWAFGPPAARARAMLARRLVRAGKLADAVTYLDGDNRAALLALIEARRRGDDLAVDVEGRARAKLEAAYLLRRQGFEIAGTEHAPDFVIWRGTFDTSEVYDPDADAFSKDLARLPERFTTDDERQRLAASAPSPDRRYHYRWQAADEAERAADLLAPRSQAFAAVLCTAARFVDVIDEGRVHGLWGRYVKQGAPVAFAPTFGKACPEPDWEGARRRREAEQARAARKAFGRVAIALGATAPIAAAFFLMRRRRRDARAPLVP
jgi:hypothetical protein